MKNIMNEGRKEGRKVNEELFVHRWHLFAFKSAPGLQKVCSAGTIDEQVESWGSLGLNEKFNERSIWGQYKVKLGFEVFIKSI